MTGVLPGRREDTGKHTRMKDVITESDIEVIQLHAKEWQDSQESPVTRKRQ